MSIVQRGSILAAADAAVSDEFGTAVAVSANGLVLAVGAYGWEDATDGQGGVYLYDWSGSAWVQRGSVLVAADAAALDHFGAAVALSADGTVLAVGAPYWEGALSAMGGVYLYDWSGSAWVQRGDVLVAADAAASDNFGVAVALSADGAVLAVGAPYWEGTATNQGGVYLYDWNAGTSTWDQRGGVLVAADRGGSDLFGSGVALSATGAVLAVGSPQWDAYTDQGGAYLYDWNAGTSTWDQRGSVLVAADAGGTDMFGAAVALSADGAQLAVGAKLWDGAVSNQGGAYLYDWNAGTSTWDQRGDVLAADDSTSYGLYGGAVALSSDGTVIVVGAPRWEAGALTDQGGVYVYDNASNVGTPTAPTTLTVEIASGTPSAPTALTVTWPTGTPSAPTRLSVTATATPTAPTLLAVVGADHAPNWRARCLIAGVDVSAQLVGQASVTAEEGAARIASLTLLPPSGTIAPLDYVGKAISLDYVLVIGGVEVPRRLFTGRIDTPAYDPDTTLLKLTCTDDLQNVVAALDRTVIDALVGGRYSEAVQGEQDDNWDYAQARLATVAASLDAGASGGLRLTPWESVTPWATWGAADLLYQRASLSLPQRSRLTNRVDIAFDYRYNRLRQRYAAAGWSGTQIDMAPAGWAYPTQQDLLGAASGTGWTVTNAVFYPAPASIPHSSGGFVRPADGAIDMAILQLTQRHSQSVTEGYTLTVRAPESVSANGELAHAMRGALASEFSGSAWESALDVEPLLTADGEIDHAPDAPRAAADYAIQTLLDQARVKILGSHRSARVGNAVLCNPDLDLDKRVAISTAEMSAAGKVAAVTHTLDFVAGSALSAFELVVFGAGGAGILAPDALDPPADPSAAADDAQDWSAGVAALMVNVYGTTPYSDDLMGLLINPPETITVEDVPGEGTVSYPNPGYVAGSYPASGFRMRMPGVDDASRNPLALPVAQDYSVVIPVDTLNFTIP